MARGAEGVLADPDANTALGAALWRTRAYLLPQLRHFVMYGVLTAFTMLLEMGAVLLVYDLLTNKVLQGEPLTELQAGLLGFDPGRFVAVEALDQAARLTVRTVFLVLAAALLSIGFALGTGLTYYLTWILQRVNQDLRLAMMDAAVHLSLRYHDDAPVGDGIYRVYQDSAMVTNVVQNGLIAPATALVNLLVALVTVSLFAPWLGVLLLVAVVPSVVVARAFVPRLREGSARARAANSALTSHIQESVHGARVLKAHQAEGRAFEAFRQRSFRALDRAYELRRTVALLNLAVFVLTAMSVIAADYLMAQWVWAEEPTFAYGVIAFVGFAVWNLGAFQAAQDRNATLSAGSVTLANLWSLLQDMGVGLARAFFVLDQEPEVWDRPGAVAMPPVERGVRFREVDFAYRPGVPVLRGVSFTAQPGTVTAVVGVSGAGKSTLMRLLLRLYEVDGGAIEIDGVDIRDIRVQSLRDGIGIVLQENALFPTTVADNIRFAAPDVDDDAVEAAAATACADGFVRDLPEGYATELGERGAKLSTGQRQRISIARAVVKNAPILLLDEPTASLDVATERQVLARLAEWGRDKVIFLVTHRIGTIRRADRILFLEDGVLVEEGDHASLMERPEGRYRAFVTTGHGDAAHAS
ncbi:MAG: ABC transporter ATP-binding protein [Gammaproteobacteria bacterium]|nr:ABC transporter ATP-binding protein [Gammaproteobacteria bacterium]